MLVFTVFLMPGGPAGPGPRAPEVAPLWADVADDGVLLVGEGGAQLGALARQVLELQADRHLVGVRQGGRRHGALDALICFPARREREREREEEAGVTGEKTLKKKKEEFWRRGRMSFAEDEFLMSGMAGVGWERVSESRPLLTR